jgi:hypothetical protein
MNTEQTTHSSTTQNVAQQPEQKPSPQKRSLTGLGMLAGGAFLLFMNWQSALSSGTYWPMMSVLAPTVIGIGVSMLLFPERKTHNALGFVGFILGIVNWLFISGTL